MVIRLFVYFSCLIVLTGCYSDEQMPRIDYSINAPTITTHAATAKPKPTFGGISSNPWIPPSSVEKNWTAVVVHHSGTPNGNATVFDKWHREGRGWDGVGYDFVIGNGTDSGNGQVETTFRWTQQRTGAHCGGTPGNWANVESVGICLVGDFNRTSPTSAQMKSLVELTRFLQGRYKIPKSRVYGHKGTPGARKTDCPGRHFSMSGLKSRII